MPTRKIKPAMPTRTPEQDAAVKAGLAYGEQQQQLRTLGPIVPPLLVTIDQLRIEAQKIKGDNARAAGVALDVAHAHLIMALAKMSILPS